MTYIRAWTRSNLVKIRRLTTELAALVRLKNRCLHIFSIATDLIYFSFVGTSTCIKSMMSSNLGQLSAFERLKIPPKTYNG